MPTYGRLCHLDLGPRIRGTNVETDSSHRTVLRVTPDRAQARHLPKERHEKRLMSYSSAFQTDENSED